MLPAFISLSDEPVIHQLPRLPLLSVRIETLKFIAACVNGIP